MTGWVIQARSKSQVRHPHRSEDDDTRSQPRMRNLRCGGHDDHEGRNLSPEELGP
jgi:hypothetical protein